MATLNDTKPGDVAVLAHSGRLVKVLRHEDFACFVRMMDGREVYKSHDVAVTEINGVKVPA